MWYFAWILGVLLAACAGILNVMWLEFQGAFADEKKSEEEEK